MLNGFIHTLKSFNLVSHTDSVLSIAAAVVTIWGFLFGVRYFLNQLKINNISINAGRSLKLVAKIEKDIELLLKEKKSEKERCKTIPIMLNGFRDLQNVLWFIEDKKIDDSFAWLENLINVLQENDHSQILTHIEGDSENKSALDRLKALKLILKEIYNIPVKWWQGLLGQIVILGIVVVFLSFLRTLDTKPDLEPRIYSFQLEVA